MLAALGRWLDSVAAASAATIVERTLHGSAEALKEWLERLAEHMDDQASVAKEVRTVVRRRAAQAETDGGDNWYEGVATGALETRWRQATSEGGALFRLRNSLWTKRRVAREARDAALQSHRGGRHRCRRGDPHVCRVMRRGRHGRGPGGGRRGPRHVARGAA